MRLVLALLLLPAFNSYAQGQSNKKITGYLFGQYNRTLYDYSREVNPWGIGLGFHGLLNTNSKFKPTLELTGDIYFATVIVETLLVPPPLQEILPADSNINFVASFFGGYSYHFTDKFYVGLLGGTSIIDGNFRFGIKPSIGFSFSKDLKFTGKISFSNVFNRINNHDFGSLVFSFGRRIF